MGLEMFFKPFTLQATFFEILTSFLFLDNNGKKFKNILSKVLNTFDNIMDNGAFVHLEQMLHFP